MGISEDLHKLMMAGIGAANVAAEKTQETVEALAKRGEEAVEQGKVLNERLRHDLNQAVKDAAPHSRPGLAEVLAAVEGFTPAEREAVRGKLAQLDGGQAADENAE